MPPESVVFTVGEVVGTHGLEGTLKVRLFSDDPEHLLTLDAFSLGEEPTSRSVIVAQLHAGQLLLTLRGIDTPEAASGFMRQPVRVPASHLRPLAPDEFFLYQLLGLSVATESGERIGTVTDLLQTGANDVLVVSPDDGSPDLLLPMIPAVVLNVDPTGGTILVRPQDYFGDS